MSTKSFSSHLGGFAFQWGKLALGYKVGENTVPSEQQGEYSPNGPDQTIDLSSSAASLSAGPWVPGSICVLHDNLTLSDQLKFMSHDGSTEFVLHIGNNSGDAIWAHWQNDSNWYSVGPERSLTPAGFILAEGELVNTNYPSAPAGLYRFTAEIALRADSPYDARDLFDITVVYGNQTLRETSFTFDLSIPVDTGGGTQTVWFGGIFRMPADGAIDIKAENKSSNARSVLMKCSHFFMNKLGD
jgi:hypothetical protein